MKAIEAAELTKAFGNAKAVDGLSFDVERGTTHGLVGPNGSGKTTTVRMLVGLLRPDRGSVRLLGGHEEDTAQRAMVGYMPADPRFPGYLTGSELLKLYSEFYAKDEIRTGALTEILSSVGLVEQSDERIASYSKGTLQRLGLAQALVGDPELLILDEPTAGVDPLGTVMIRGLLESLSKKGKTILISTHILAEVEKLCESATILKHGRALVSGPLDSLYSRVGTNLLEVELAEITDNVLRGLRSLPFIDDLSLEGRKILIRLSDPKDRRLEVSKTIASCGGTIVSFGPSTGRMEDAFLYYVTGRGNDVKQSAESDIQRHSTTFGALRAAALTERKAEVGRDVALELSLTNTGETPLRLTAVEEALPEGTRLKDGPSSFNFEKRRLELSNAELGPLESRSLKLVFQADRPCDLEVSPRIFYVDGTGEPRVHLVNPTSLRITESTPSLPAESSRKVMEYLKAEFLRDSLDMNLSSDASGWRSLVQIAEATGLSTSSFYGKNHSFGPAISGLLSSGAVESKTFERQRGRGGEVVKMRVRQEFAAI